MASADEFVIREYRQGDELGILRLLNEVFAEDDPHFVPRTMAQWRWMYEQNPAGREVVVAAAPDGRIVGHYACLPYRVKVAGRELRCGQGVDSMVSAEHRRGLKAEGLFLRTARRYFATFGVPARNAYGYGFPNRKALRIGIKLLQYVPVHAPVRTLGRNLFAFADDEVVGRGEIAHCEEIVSCGEDVDALWQRLAGEVAMGTIRDARFLNWRYRDCPFATYRMVGLRGESGGLRGLYVARDGWTGPPIRALAELLVPRGDPAACRHLLAHAVADARQRGQQRVEVWFPPWHPWYALALQHGFTAEDSPFHLCIKIYAPSLDPGWVPANWFFGIGDTDVF